MMGAPETALLRLQEIGRVDPGDFLFFEVQPDPRHPTIEADGLAYEGRRSRVLATLAGRPYGRPFGTDVAFAEPLVGEPEVLEGEPWLDFLGLPATRVRVYPLTAHITEKVHAYTLPRPSPNSRVKDLPDIALLAASAGSITETAIRSSIVATFGHRATHPVPTALPAPPAFWTAAYRELAREQGLAWRDLDALMVEVRAFLDPALAGATGCWDPVAWMWRDTLDAENQAAPPFRT